MFPQGQPCRQDPRGMGFHGESYWVPNTALLLLTSPRKVLTRDSLNPFLLPYRKTLKTSGCWIVPFYMMTEQQPNLMACRGISKGTVSWRGRNPYCTDIPLHPALGLPAHHAHLPPMLQRGSCCSNVPEN